MRQMKYIIAKGPYGTNIPFIFHDQITHDDYRRMLGVDRADVHSAGFCFYHETEGGWSAYGESISIGVGTNTETQEIFDQAFSQGKYQY